MNQFTLSFLVRQLGIRTSLFQTLHTTFGDIIVQYVPCSETTTIDSHGCVVWTYTFCVQDVDLPSGVSSVCAITPDILKIPYMTAVAPLYFEDSETVDVQGNGSSILPYSFHAIIDPDADNALEARANGLFATDTTLNLIVEDEYSGISSAPVTSINFVGDGVVVTESATPGEVDVTISGDSALPTPENGSSLVWCGGELVNKPDGMDFYPVTRTLVWTKTGVGNETFTATLSGKPDAFDCSTKLYAVFSVRLFVNGSTGDLMGHAYVNNVKVAQASSDSDVSMGSFDNTQAIVDVGLGAATTELKVNTDNGNGTENGGGLGTVSVEFYLEGYFQ